MGSGTVSGLMAFFDFLVHKRLATAAAISPLRSAAKQVFETVEGTEDVEEIDVRGLDIDDYLDRFQVGAIQTGRYKPESIQAYRKRFSRGIQYYVTYLETGTVPKIGVRSNGVRAAKPGSTAPSEKGASTTQAPATSADVGATSQRNISYPFPLQSGGIATLHLPARLEKVDAERLSAFIRTLVLEPQRELSAGSGSDEHER